MSVENLMLVSKKMKDLKVNCDDYNCSIMNIGDKRIIVTALEKDGKIYLYPSEDLKEIMI